MRCCLLFLVLLGCDEPAGSYAADGGGDGGRAEAGLDRGSTDARLVDARLVDARAPDARLMDARAVDARPADARVADGQVDARLVDARMADARVVDARMPDAAQPDARPADAQGADAAPPDAQVDAAPPPPCVGIVLPPPPDSPDGREVCNYRDDDGDGLVDEGFPYDFLGEPVRITQGPEVGPTQLNIARSGDGYGVIWDGPHGYRFLKLGDNGCPTRALQIFDQNPDDVIIPNSMRLAFSGGRFATVFTERRREANRGFGTFVQLFEEDGTPVGAPIDLDSTLSFFGYNAILPVGNDFAIFGSAFHPDTGGLTYSAFVIMDREGRVVTGPSHPYNAAPGLGQAMSPLIGMAYDGEGFGMAWHGVDNWFMRWSPNGDVLTPPVQPAEIGVRARLSGIAWTGQHYVVPNDGVDGRHLRLAFVTPMGGSQGAVELGTSEFFTLTYFVDAMGSGVAHYGAHSGAFFRRLDGAGGETAPVLAVLPADHMRGLTSVPSGPFASLAVRDVDPRIEGDLMITFSLLGCR